MHKSALSTCQVQVFWNSSDRSEPQVAKAHRLLPEVAVEFQTASSHGSLAGQTNFSLPPSARLAKRPVGRPKQRCSTALSPLVLMPKTVNRAITRGKCPTTSPGLRHDRLPLRVGACLSWSLPLSCSTMNVSPIRGSLITTVASKTSAGS